MSLQAAGVTEIYQLYKSEIKALGLFFLLFPPPFYIQRLTQFYHPMQVCGILGLGEL